MVSICIQGGAMRSIYCLGAVRALTLRNCAADVSGIYAASAGCVSGAVLASHLSGTLPVDIETTTGELLNRLGKRFIDERRFSGIVDVDYLVKVILETTNVSPAGLHEQGMLFEVAVTNAVTAAAGYFELSAMETRERLAKALVATMAIPVLYRIPAMIDSVKYVDGGITDPLPLFRALATKPETVIAISSVAFGDLAEEVRGKEKTILRVAPGISPTVRQLMLTRNPLADATESALSMGSIAGIELIHVSPSRPEMLSSRLELDTVKLKRLELMGFEDANGVFDKAGLK